MPIGTSNTTDLLLMHLGIDDLHWVNEIKYLGVTLQSGAPLVVNTDVNCQKFLGAPFSLLL